MVRSVNVKKTKSSKKIVLKITMSMTSVRRQCKRSDEHTETGPVQKFFRSASAADYGILDFGPAPKRRHFLLCRQ